MFVWKCFQGKGLVLVFSATLCATLDGSCFGTSPSGHATGRRLLKVHSVPSIVFPPLKSLREPHAQLKAWPFCHARCRPVGFGTYPISQLLSAPRTGSSPRTGSTTELSPPEPRMTRHLPDRRRSKWKEEGAMGVRSSV